jgi:hypothetical protein
VELFALTAVELFALPWSSEQSHMPGTEPGPGEGEIKKLQSLF